MTKNNNMFSLLMSEDEEDEIEPTEQSAPSPKASSYTHPKFTIVKGHCQPVFHADKGGFLSKMSIFYGRCYLCFSVGHSQKWCCLKWCPRCGQFGHSAVTCMSTKPLTWKRKYHSQHTKRECHNKVVRSVLRQLVETVVRQHEGQ